MSDDDERTAAPVTVQPHATGQGAIEPGTLTVGVKFTTERFSEEGSFVVYEISVEAGEGNDLGIPPGETNVYRRYNNFRFFAQFLNAAYPHIIIPPVPEKKINFSVTKMAVDASEEDFVRRRKDTFNKFVIHVMDHPVLRKDKAVQAFMLQDEGWKEQLSFTDPFTGETAVYTGKSWKDTFANFSMSRKGDAPPEEFTTFRNFSTTWFDNVAAVINAHEVLAVRVQGTVDTYDKMMMGVSDLSEHMERMKAPLVATAQAMGSIAKATDKRLAFEQRDMAESLYNLLLYINSIKVFLKNEEIANHQVVKAGEALASKKKTLQAIKNPEQSKGLSGMFTRLTTSTSDEKIASLEEDVCRLEEQLEQRKRAYSEFVDKGKAEIKYFHEVKVHEMLLTLLDFARIQKAHSMAMVKHWSKVKMAMAAPGAQ